MEAVEAEFDKWDTVLGCERRAGSSPGWAEAAGRNLRSCPIFKK